MAPTGDERFARLRTDPRFRRPKQKQLKVEIDERFRDVLESEEFGGKTKGKTGGKGKDDKRGRPISSSHSTDQLKRFYRLKSPSPTSNEVEDGSGFVDYARGEGLLESSGSEDESGDDESEISDEELEIGGKSKRTLSGNFTNSDSESESDEASDVDEDEDHLNIDLSETDEPVPSAFPDEDLDAIAEAEEEDEEEDDGPTTDPTDRLAIVNLDWDNLQAADLYTVFSSFLRSDARKIKGKKEAPKGKVVNVKIYPSEFGKERMRLEEEQGPGGGMFISKSKPKSKNTRSEKKGRRDQEEIYEDSDEQEEDSQNEGEEEYDDEEDDDEEGISSDGEGSDMGSGQSIDEDEFESGDLPDMSAPTANALSDDDRSSRAGSEDIDMTQLRQYQLERLRYYYAVATFSSVAAAEYIMEEVNGTEYERTANVFDMKFVPEGMEFEEDEVKDVCTKEPKAYKGNDFVTDALRHSKVKLTWDQDDPNRAKYTRKALTREEIEEQDFENLVAGSDSDASSSAESDESNSDDDADTANLSSKDKAKARKAKIKERKAALRALLLKTDGDGESDGQDGPGDIWGKAGRYADVDTDQPDANAANKNGGMEITFKSALTDGVGAEDDNLTSLERYQMRQKEKKARKKEKMEAKRAARGDDELDGQGVNKAKDRSSGKPEEEDDFFGGSDEEEEDDADRFIGNASDDESDAPLADDKEASSTSTGGGISGKTHFSMKDIISDEKTQGGKKSNRRKRAAERKREAKNVELGRVREKELGDQGWKIDVKDPRFKVLHEEAEFAIDPSNPAYIKTQAMQDLLAERARVRNSKRDIPVDRPLKVAQRTTSSGDGISGGDGPDLAQLVGSVKRKAELSGNGNGSNHSDPTTSGAGRDGDHESGAKKRKRSRPKKGGAASASAKA